MGNGNSVSPLHANGLVDLSSIVPIMIDASVHKAADKIQAARPVAKSNISALMSDAMKNVIASGEAAKKSKKQKNRVVPLISTKVQIPSSLATVIQDTVKKMSRNGENASKIVEKVMSLGLANAVEDAINKVADMSDYEAYFKSVAKARADYVQKVSVTMVMSLIEGYRLEAGYVGASQHQQQPLFSLEALRAGRGSNDFASSEANNGRNSAFLFIKPHANTRQTQSLVTSTLTSKGIRIEQEGELTAEQIDKGMLIDQHYYAIASKATLLKPKDIPVPAKKFEEFFGISWGKALMDNVAYNALDACTYFGINAAELSKLWSMAKKVKFGGGFYCGLIDIKEVPTRAPIYVFNAFFMDMRAGFVKPGTSIHYYVVNFEKDNLSWKDFRGLVLGPTDPKEAPEGSIRATIYKDWVKLGLKAVPNTGDNGVHASASPFEGLAEKMNWLNVDPLSDDFGKKLIAAGISEETIREWSVDPLVEGLSLFDQLEDLDAFACVEKSKSLNLANVIVDSNSSNNSNQNNNRHDNKQMHKSAPPPVEEEVRVPESGVEVLPFLFVSGLQLAKSYKILRALGVTHIVNCCSQSTPCYFYQKDEDRDISKEIVYYPINLSSDAHSDQDISWYIVEVIHFIENCKANGGKVLIHCDSGSSKSCSLAVAYVMWSRRLGWRHAVNFVKTRIPHCDISNQLICNLLDLEAIFSGQMITSSLIYRLAYPSQQQQQQQQQQPQGVLKLCRVVGAVVCGQSPPLQRPCMSMLHPKAVFVITSAVPTVEHCKGDVESKESNNGSCVDEGKKDNNTRVRSKQSNIQRGPVIYVWKGRAASSASVQIALSEASRMIGILYSHSATVELVEEDREPLEMFDHVDDDGPFQTSKSTGTRLVARYNDYHYIIPYKAAHSSPSTSISNANSNDTSTAFNKSQDNTSIREESVDMEGSQEGIDNISIKNRNRKKENKQRVVLGQNSLKGSFLDNNNVEGNDSINNLFVNYGNASLYQEEASVIFGQEEMSIMDPGLAPNLGQNSKLKSRSIQDPTNRDDDIFGDLGAAGDGGVGPSIEGDIIGEFELGGGMDKDELNAAAVGLTVGFADEEAADSTTASAIYASFEHLEYSLNSNDIHQQLSQYDSNNLDDPFNVSTGGQIANAGQGKHGVLTVPVNEGDVQASYISHNINPHRNRNAASPRVFRQDNSNNNNQVNGYNGGYKMVVQLLDPRKINNRHHANTLNLGGPLDSESSVLPNFFSKTGGDLHQPSHTSSKGAKKKTTKEAKAPKNNLRVMNLANFQDFNNQSLNQDSQSDYMDSIVYINDNSGTSGAMSNINDPSPGSMTSNVMLRIEGKRSDNFPRKKAAASLTLVDKSTASPGAVGDASVIMAQDREGTVGPEYSISSSSSIAQNTPRDESESLSPRKFGNDRGSRSPRSPNADQRHPSVVNNVDPFLVMEGSRLKISSNTISTTSNDNSIGSSSNTNINNQHYNGAPITAVSLSSSPRISEDLLDMDEITEPASSSKGKRPETMPRKKVELATLEKKNEKLGTLMLIDKKAILKEKPVLSQHQPKSKVSVPGLTAKGYPNLDTISPIPTAQTVYRADITATDLIKTPLSNV